MHELSDGQTYEVDDLYITECYHCDKKAIWYKKKMFYPDSLEVPSPNPDLKDEIQHDYLEAASILNKSPRGAAALLRLCLQKLCLQLGEKGKNIYDDIESLVKKGLSPKIQKALDIMRVIGNNAVHPGQIDWKDNKEVATQLFTIINLIAEDMITKPKMIDEMYNSLPQSSLEGIEQRDKK